MIRIFLRNFCCFTYDLLIRQGLGLGLGGVDTVSSGTPAAEPMLETISKDWPSIMLLVRV